MARDLSKADYLELEMLPAFQRLISLWKARKADYVYEMAYSDKLTEINRAEKRGRLKEIDEILAWIDTQVGRPKQLNT